MVPQALAAMAAYPQWMLWIAVPRGDGRTDKLPVNPRTLQVCDAHSPDSWTDAATAYVVAAGSQGKYGVAFVFTAADPFFFIDIDHCLQSDGTWSQLANQMVEAFGA